MLSCALSYWRLSRRTPEKVGLVRDAGGEWLLFQRSNIDQHQMRQPDVNPPDWCQLSRGGP